MEYLSYLLIPIITGVIFSIMKKESKKSESLMSETNFTIRQPKQIKWIGFIDAILFSSAMILVIVTKDESINLWMYIIFFAFILLGVYIVYYSVKWKMDVIENEIQITPAFGDEKTIMISDITKIKLKPQSVVAYSENKRLFSVDLYCAGSNLLIERFKKENITFYQ